MVLLTRTNAISKAIAYLDSEGELAGLGVEPSSTSSLADDPIQQPLSHDQIIAISRRVRDVSKTRNQETSVEVPDYHLDDLLRGCHVYVEPAKAKPEPTSEYKALMARLRKAEEQRAYERMTNPQSPPETFAQRFPGSQGAHLFPTTQADLGDDDNISYADINRQMTLIINILVSIVACGIAFWMMARHWSVPSRLGLSMGGSGLVGVAEAVVYLGYLRRIKGAREKSKKEVEVKEIIKTWVIGSEEEVEKDKVRLVPAMGENGETVRKRRPIRNGPS